MFSDLLKQKIVKPLLCVSLLGLLLACDKSVSNSPIAKAVIDDYFIALQQGDSDKALGYYSSKRPAEEWRAHFEHRQQQLGTLLSYQMERVETSTTLHGQFNIFDYSTQYSNNDQVSETLTVFNAVDAEETAIVGHKITAIGYKSLLQ